MQLGQFHKTACSRLEKLYPAPEAQSIVRMLCSAMFSVGDYEYAVNPTREIPDERAAVRALERLEAYEPVQYVLGKAYFYGREYDVGPAVLIPRPETEQLCGMTVDCCRRLEKGRIRILDLCTGSGCIAWTLSQEIPGCEVLGVDISAEAVEMADGQKFPLPSGVLKPRFAVADIFDDRALSVALEGQQFDIIVSNPPYVMDSEKSAMRRNVLDFEPQEALFVSDCDPLLFYRRIAQVAEIHAPSLLWGCVEINENMGVATEDIFKNAGYSQAAIHTDFMSRDRFVSFAGGPA